MSAPTFEQRDGGDVIDTRLHRAAPIHQPPLPDTAHDWRMDEAHLADLEAEAELMRWTRKDSVWALVVVAASIAASAYSPGVWFAGWLK
ncbi:MAG TPA: hypothetical protein VNV16_12565 [Methylibium sp.]|nr:hypothetical protein [Methylibium sp.]